jgi:hypothetical protein
VGDGIEKADIERIQQLISEIVQASQGSAEVQGRLEMARKDEENMRILLASAREELRSTEELLARLGRLPQGALPPEAKIGQLERGLRVLVKASALAKEAVEADDAARQALQARLLNAWLDFAEMMATKMRERLREIALLFREARADYSLLDKTCEGKARREYGRSIVPPIGRAYLEDPFTQKSLANIPSVWRREDWMPLVGPLGREVEKIHDDVRRALGGR